MKAMLHRVTIYWKIDTYRAHMLQYTDGLPMAQSLNGEQYLEVDDKTLEVLKDYEAKGLIDFRNKQLIDTPHGLQPDTQGMLLTNTQL